MQSQLRSWPTLVPGTVPKVAIIIVYMDQQDEQGDMQSLGNCDPVFKRQCLVRWVMTTFNRHDLRVAFYLRYSQRHGDAALDTLKADIQAEVKRQRQQKALTSTIATD